MSNHLYSQKHSPISNLYYSNNSSTSRSILDNDNTTSSYYYRDNHHDNSYSSSRYYPSSTSYSDYAPSSFDISSSFSKRPSQALYNYSPLGAHMLGQSEAWLTSDSLAKRPKLKSACLLPVYPQRPGEKDCAHYMLTRTCKFGEACRFDHPIWVPDGGIPDWKEIQLPPVAPEFHPQRPGEPDCPHFLKTQNCKFGLNCKFNHPLDKLGISAKIDTADLPERPSEPQCSFYVKTGKCKFGATCKFHHPKGIIPSDGQEATNKDQTKENGDPTNDRSEVKTFIPNATPSFNSKGLPKRLGEEDCPFYLKTGSCKYAANCRYNHPDRNAISPLATPIPNLTVGLVNPAASILQSFQPSLAQTTVGLGPIFYPQRPGQAECDFYMKNGVCKYGESCKFHHPIDRSAPKNVNLTLAGLPRREGVSDCAFYMKTGTCKYGATCKFDHPPPGEVKASASKENGTTVDEAEENVKSTGQ